MNYPDSWKQVSCFDWCEDDEYLWLVLSNRNAICEVEKQSCSVRILGHFPNKEYGEAEMSYSTIKVDEYVVFAPFSADHIAVYDTKLHRLDFIEVAIINRRLTMDYRHRAKFYRMFANGRKLFILGLSYPGIVVVDFDAKDIMCFDGWVKKIDSMSCRKAVRITDGHAVKDGQVFFPLGNCNGLLKVNLTTMDWDYVDLKEELFGILGIAQKGDKVWMTCHKNDSKWFGEWDMMSGGFEKIELVSSDSFYAPIVWKNYLVFFGNEYNRSFTYNIQTHEIEEISECLKDYGKILAAKAYRDGIHFFSKLCGGIFILDVSKKCIAQKVEYQINDDVFLQESWTQFVKKNIIKASKETVKEDDAIFGLKEFIEAIVM